MELNKYPTPHPQAASRIVDGSAVVILADEGQVNVFNSVGTRVWELADGSRTVQQIIDTVIAEFDVAAERATAEVQEFLQSLIDKKAVVLESKPLGEYRIHATVED
jgi:hypothetical protein